MNVKRMTLGALAGLAATALVLTGCSSGDTPSATAAPEPPAQVDGTLNVLLQGDAPPGDDPLITEFQAAYPDVDVKMEYIPGADWESFFSSVLTRLASGKKYDLIYLPTEGERLFVSKGLLTPLDSWIDRDEAELEDFHANANQTILDDAQRLASDGDDTYFIPFIFNTVGMYLHKPTFEAAGVELPAPDWSWDDFLATCEALDAAQVDYCYAARTDFFAGIQPWLTTNDANVLNEDWTEATANTPEAIEAVGFVQDIVERGYSPIPGGKYDMASLFTQGKIAMQGGGAWVTTELLDAGASLEDFAIVPWPQNAGLGSPVGWGAWGMMKDTQNPEAAWALIKFMLTPEMQDQIGEKRINSALPVLGTSIEHALATNPEGYQYLYEALDYATPVPGPDAAVLVQQATTEIYTNILTGNVAPDSGMNDLDQRISDALK